MDAALQIRNLVLGLEAICWLPPVPLIARMSLDTFSTGHIKARQEAISAFRSLFLTHTPLASTLTPPRSLSLRNAGRLLEMHIPSSSLPWQETP